jgi:hypothetical protein
VDKVGSMRCATLASRRLRKSNVGDHAPSETGGNANEGLDWEGKGGMLSKEQSAAVSESVVA